MDGWMDGWMNDFAIRRFDLSTNRSTDKLRRDHPIMQTRFKLFPNRRCNSALLPAKHVKLVSSAFIRVVPYSVQIVESSGTGKKGPTMDPCGTTHVMFFFFISQTLLHLHNTVVSYLRYTI